MGACPSYGGDGFNETELGCRPTSTLSIEPTQAPTKKKRSRNPLAGLDREALYALELFLTPLLAVIIFWIVTEALRRCLRPWEGMIVFVVLFTYCLAAIFQYAFLPYDIRRHCETRRLIKRLTMGYYSSLFVGGLWILLVWLTQPAFREVYPGWGSITGRCSTVLSG